MNRLIPNGLPVWMAALVVTSPLAQTTILQEDFEDGLLDPRISVGTVGTFLSPSGIKAFADFGSQQAYGFGRSTNRLNSFDSFVTTLTVDFGQDVEVAAISFKEMEVFGNWGSGGYIFLDGVKVQNDFVFGRFPYNDGQADASPRQFNLAVNQVVRRIGIQVWDITDLSEIYIDDLRITSGVPEPTSPWLLLACLPLAWLAVRRSVNAPGRGSSV